MHKRLLTVVMLTAIVVLAACGPSEPERDPALVGVWHVPYTQEVTRRYFFADGSGTRVTTNWGQLVSSEFQWYTENGQLRISFFDDWNFEWGNWSTVYYTISGYAKTTENFNGTIRTLWYKTSNDPGTFRPGGGVTVPGAPTFPPGGPQFAH